MAVRLDINVRGVKGLGGSAGGGGRGRAADPVALERKRREAIQKNSQLRLRAIQQAENRQRAAAEREFARLQKLVKAADKADQKRVLAFIAADKRAHALSLKRAQALARGRMAWDKRVQRARQAGERDYQRQRKAADRRAHQKEMARIARRKRAMRGMARGAGALGGGIGGMGRGLGAGIGRIGLGGGGLGGAVRGIGGAAGGLVGGAGSAAGGALSMIPGIGGLAGGIVKGVTGAMAGVVQAAGNIAGAFVDKFVGIVKVGLLAGLGLAFVAVRKAMQFERIQTGFAALIETIGTTAPAAMERLRVASKGTSSDLDLMRTANQGILLGAVQSTGQLELMITASRRLAKVTGRDATESFNRMALAIGKGERRLLDELGIVVRATDAQRNYAAAHGKTVQQLTASEKVLAFQAEVFESIKRKLAALGPEVMDFGDRWNQFTSSIENFMVKAGQPLIDVLGKILAPLARIITAIGEWFSKETTKGVTAFKSAIEPLVTLLEGLAAVAEHQGIVEMFDIIMVGAKAAFEAIEQRVRGIFALLKSEAIALFQEMEGKKLGGPATVALGHLTDFMTPLSSYDHSEKAESIQDEYNRRAKGTRARGQMLNRAYQASGSRLMGRGLAEMQERMAPAQGAAAMAQQTFGTGPGTANNLWNPWAPSYGANFGQPAAATGPVGTNTVLAPGGGGGPVPVTVVTPGGGGAPAGGRPAGGLQALPTGGGTAAAGPSGAVFNAMWDFVETMGDFSEPAQEILAEALKTIEGQAAVGEQFLAERAKARVAGLKETEDAARLAKKITTTTRAIADAARDKEKAERDLVAIRQHEKDLWEKFALDIDAVHDRMNDAFTKIAETLEKTIVNLKKSFAASLAGAEGDPAISGRFRTAFGRGDAMETMAIKKDFKRKFGHISGGEAARSPRLRAEMAAFTMDRRMGDARREAAVREDVVKSGIAPVPIRHLGAGKPIRKPKPAFPEMAREVGPEGEAAKAAAEEVAKAREAADKAKAELKEAHERELKALKDLTTTSEDLWKTSVDTSEKMADRLKDAEEKLAEVKARLDQVNAAMAASKAK